MVRSSAGGVLRQGDYMIFRHLEGLPVSLLGCFPFHVLGRETRGSGKKLEPDACSWTLFQC